jgi:hypothetical protein
VYCGYRPDTNYHFGNPFMQENPELDPSFIIPTMKIRTDMYEA